MLSYNTRLKRLALPEYGRTIQSMVDHCLTIEDRDERTRCARSIIAAMNKLVPSPAANSDEHRQKLWDHLAIMSDFKLDIDYPCEVVRPENLGSLPDAVDRGQNRISHRHYGKYIERSIETMTQMEERTERDALALLIANHMKKAMLAVNVEGVDDARIFRDLAEMSHGVIILRPETARLHEFHQEVKPATGKKKKKK